MAVATSESIVVTVVLAVALTLIVVALTKFRAAIVCAEVELTVAVVAVASTIVSFVLAPRFTSTARVAAAAVMVVVVAPVDPDKVNFVKPFEVTVLVAPPAIVTSVNVLPVAAAVPDLSWIVILLPTVFVSVAEVKAFATAVPPTVIAAP